MSQSSETAAWETYIPRNDEVAVLVDGRCTHVAESGNAEAAHFLRLPERMEKESTNFTN